MDGGAEDDKVVIEEIDPKGDKGQVSGEGGAAQGTDGIGDRGNCTGEEHCDAAGKDVGENQEDEETDVPDAGEGQGEDSSMDAEMKKIEKEKEGLSAADKLERSFAYKIEGNEFFKKNDLVRSADCYYRAVLFSRDLMQNPKYYPKLGHTEAQRDITKGLIESVFTNLALVQSKYAMGLSKGGERDRVLKEAARSAGEALKLNEKNVKALYRRGLCRSLLAKDAAEEALGGGGSGTRLRDAQDLGLEAKADLVATIKEDERNRDARVELKAVQDLLKQLRQEEVSRDKKEFSFASTLTALKPKEEDILGDRTVRKQQVIKAGDGGAQWFNKDWLLPQARQRCVVHVRCRLCDHTNSSIEPSLLIFTLGDTDMHEGIQVAARSIAKGELSSFVIASKRVAVDAALARRLPKALAEESTWEIELLKYAVYEDQEGDRSRLLKILSEGYGHFPKDLAECHVHWKVTGPDGATLHSSRQTVSFGQAGGIEQKEDPDRLPYVYILGENTWEPVAALCRVLRQGGQGELRLKRAPALPEKDPGAPADAVSAQLGAMLNKTKADSLQDCCVHVELERVLQPLQGPEDPAWAGTASLVQERFRAEQLLDQEHQEAALRRFRRACGWAEQLKTTEVTNEFAQEHAALRAGLAWVLAKRAAPILDLGTVSSDVIKAAEADLAEAEGHCKWLDEHHPGLPRTLLVRAKVCVAQDDDFETANKLLLEAQRLSPDDICIQHELKAVRVELHKHKEAISRGKISTLKKGLLDAQAEGLGTAGSGGEAKAAALLAELALTSVSWDVVMDTRVGVELKRIQELSSEAATKKLCKDILGSWMDQSKEQRPMW